MKKTCLHRVSPVLFLLLLALAQAPCCEAGIGERVLEARLANGLKVILLENHRTPTITFQVWYRVGSRNEEWGKTGLAHVLEHMMFKGTKKVSGPGFLRRIESTGGSYNAFTSSDFTAYFETISADRIQVALDLEADRMRNLVLRSEDFHTERMVVIEERRMRTDDNPQAYLQEQVEAAAFQAQPYHWPIIGWSDDLARLTLEDLRAFYNTYYAPANAFIVAVGDFKKEDFLARIRKSFGSIRSGVAPKYPGYRDPPREGERRVTVEKEAKLPSLLLAYNAVNLHNPDWSALEVIAGLLAGGRSSRLEESLVRAKGLARQVETEYSQVTVDPGLFYISVDLLPGKDAAEAEEALDGEIARLRKEPVGEAELERARNRLEAEFTMAQDSLFNQGMLLAQFEIAGGWKAIDDYVPSIRRVTAQDVQHVADKYLKKSNRTTGVLVPLPYSGEKAEPSGPAIKEKVIRHTRETGGYE